MLPEVSHYSSTFLSFKPYYGDWESIYYVKLLTKCIFLFRSFSPNALRHKSSDLSYLRKRMGQIYIDIRHLGQCPKFKIYFRFNDCKYLWRLLFIWLLTPQVIIEEPLPPSCQTEVHSLRSSAPSLGVVYISSADVQWCHLSITPALRFQWRSFRWIYVLNSHLISH